MILLPIVLAMNFQWACAQNRPYETESPSADAGVYFPAQLTAEEIADGWIALFDDKSDFGWRAESKVDWNFEDGSISASKGEVGLLRTTSQFDNFILKLEFRCDERTNSGVFIRTSPKPKNPARDCYEINIAPDDNPFPTGSIVARKKSGTHHEPQRDWTEMTIVANAGKITVKCDGVTTCELEDKAPLGRGYIGLQFNEGAIAFRKVRLKPLFAKSVFDGSSLENWKTYPELDTDVAVANQAIQLKGGPGQLESKKTFADFVFQTQCRTNAKGLNSGVFFRCIPGEKMNGYESQIDNEFKDNDRAKPGDCGTGGIFRRQNARRVNANDEEWFTKTIVAVGPHVAVWVNGLQVSDWTDKRKDDENPRRGRRLKAGTIIFQGHDPTTDLSFRKIYMRELDSRGK